MSWKKYSRSIKWYSLFQGLYTEEPVGDIPTDVIVSGDLSDRGPKRVEGASYLAQANNVYGPGVSRIIRKRPGFTGVHTNAINAAGVITSIIHQGEIGDNLICTASIAAGSHNIYNANAANDPPVAIAGGTNFTIGQDNLIDAAHFHDGTNPGTIFVSRQRDLPQFLTGTPTRSDFTIAGTGLTSLLPRIMEVFGQRALYGDCNRDGTVFDDRVYWSAIRDGNLINDHTVDFESFETREKDKVRALRKISDLILVGKLNNIFSMVITPTGDKPFAIQEEPGGRYKGPVSQQAMLEADQRVFWLGQTNIHSFDQFFRIRDWADVIKPTILGLNASRLEFAVAGYDIDRNLILFSVSASGSTTHDTIIALNIKTAALYLWSLARNAFGQRLASGDNQLLGGGYVGRLWRELNGTAGDLDNATSVIDADVFSPRFWLAYGHKIKIPFVLLSVDPIGTEQITVQYRIDDDTTWSTPDESPIVVSGTDHKLYGISLKVWAERIQFRIRNNRTDEVYAVKSIGIPGLPTQPIVS